MSHIGGGTAGEKEKRPQPAQAWQSDFNIRVLCKQRGVKETARKRGKRE